MIYNKIKKNEREQGIREQTGETRGSVDAVAFVLSLAVFAHVYFPSSAFVEEGLDFVQQRLQSLS